MSTVYVCCIQYTYMITYAWITAFLFALSSMKRRVVRQLILLQKKTMERVTVQDSPAEGATEKKSLLGGTAASEGVGHPVMCMYSGHHWDPAGCPV